MEFEPRLIDHKLEILIWKYTCMIEVLNISDESVEIGVHHYNQPTISSPWLLSLSWQNSSMDQLNYLPSLDMASCAWIQLEKITQHTD